MVLNILKAIGGLGSPTAGSSDLAAWLGLQENADFYRAQALLTLSHYRWSALNNNWRFIHLDHALRGLRNIVFALSALILLLFALALLQPTFGPASPTKVDIVSPVNLLPAALAPLQEEIAELSKVFSTVQKDTISQDWFKRLDERISKVEADINELRAATQVPPSKGGGRHK